MNLKILEEKIKNIKNEESGKKKETMRLQLYKDIFICVERFGNPLLKKIAKRILELDE